MILAIAAAAMLSGAGRQQPRAERNPRPAPNLNPAKASSGNKARLLERYQRRQARLRKGEVDHG